MSLPPVPFDARLETLQTDTVADLKLFGPELAICGTIIGLLLLRTLFGRRLSAALLTLVGSGVALGLAIHDSWVACCGAEALRRTEIFGGLLVYDGLTTYFRTFLLAFTVLFVLVTWRSGIPDRDDGPDFYTLALGSVLGMCLMASSNHLLMVFLGIEMASVPSYALAGLLKGRRESSEAALKFAVYGAGAAGVMLYGISLIAGVVGAVHLPTMAAKLAALLASSPPSGTIMVLALAGLMIMVGLAFKLSAVPFHFWTPDVFEGAAAEIGGFLSVASKAAAIALLLRVALGFGQVPAEVALPKTSKVATAVPAAKESDEKTHEAGKAHTPAHAHEATEAKKVTPVAFQSAHERRDALQPARTFIVNLLTLIAAVTATFGNLAAYGQTNIKRLLAYSTIAHAGYMIMPVAAAVSLAGSDAVKAEQAVGSVTFYVAMYLFMNLGAFAIVAFVRNEIRSEQIADYGGLMQRSPGLAICLATILFSLVGLPPLAGFAAKFAIFASLVDAQMYLLLTVGVLNSVLSLFYYLRVVTVMVWGAEPRRPAPYIPMLTSLTGLCVLLLSLPVLVFGIYYWGPAYDWAVRAAAGLIAP
jgi:NADH-quinone oxidoreductase subunit N